MDIARRCSVQRLGGGSLALAKQYLGQRAGLKSLPMKHTEKAESDKPPRQCERCGKGIPEYAGWCSDCYDQIDQDDRDSGDRKDLLAETVQERLDRGRTKADEMFERAWRDTYETRDRRL